MSNKIKTTKQNSLIARGVEILQSPVGMILTIIAICVLFLINYVQIFDVKADPNGDNISYFMLAQSLHNGTGYSIMLANSPTPHTHFPPGYPAFMALLMNFFPDNIAAMKIANGVLLMLSVVLLYFMICRVTNKNVLIAILTCVLVVTHAELLHWATIMMSEMLFMFLTFAILLMTLNLDVTALFTRQASWKEYCRLILIALAITYLYFVRTMGASLVVALVLFIVMMEIKKTHRNWLIVLAIVLIPFFVGQTCWTARNKAVRENYSSDYVGDFMRKANGETMTNFGDWTKRLSNNFRTYVTYHIPDSIFEYSHKKPLKSPPFWHWFIGFVLIALIIYGLLATYEPKTILIFLYVLTTFGVLMVWTELYAGKRYFLTLLPLLLFGMLNGCYQLTSKLLRTSYNVVPPLVILVITMLLIPRYIMAQSIDKQLAKIDSWSALSTDDNLGQYVMAAEWCGDNLPDTAIVCCRKPELFYINSKFHKACGFSQYATEDSIISELQHNKANYVILDVLYVHASVTMLPTIKKYPDKFKLIHNFGNTLLMQFNPNAGYQGELSDGKPHGYGKEVFIDNTSYEGQYLNGKPHGFGIYRDAQGTTLYEGEWNNGNPLDQ